MFERPPSEPPTPTEGPPGGEPTPQPRRARQGPYPVVTWALIAINLVVFVVPELTGLSDSVFFAGAKINTFIQRGEYYRLFTAMFLHAGLPHVALNMFSLYNLGAPVEGFMGRWRYLALYLVSGLSCSVLSYLKSPFASVGASGAIAGVAAALVVFLFVNRHVEPIRRSGNLPWLLVILAINVAYGLQPGSAVDNWGHLGGFLGGLALAVWMVPRFVPLHDASGQQIGWRLQQTSAASWAAVPLVLAVLWVAVAFVPPPPSARGP
jgi:rhomboid protease GluP